MENKSKEELEKEFQEAYGKPEKSKSKTVKKQKPVVKTKEVVKHSDKDLQSLMEDIDAINFVNEQRAQGKNVKSIKPEEAFKMLKENYNVTKKA